MVEITAASSETAV